MAPKAKLTRKQKGYVTKTAGAHMWIALPEEFQDPEADHSKPTASMAHEHTESEQKEVTIDHDSSKDMDDDLPAVDWRKLTPMQRMDMSTLYNLKVPANTPNGFASTGPYWPFTSATTAAKKILQQLRGDDFADHFMNNCDILNANTLRAELDYDDDTHLPFEIVFDSISGKEVVHAMRRGGAEKNLTLYVVRKTAEPEPVYGDLTSGTTLHDRASDDGHGQSSPTLTQDTNAQQAKLSAFGNIEDWDLDSAHITIGAANRRASGLLRNWHNIFETRKMVSNAPQQDEMFAGYLLGRRHEAMDMKLMAAVEDVEQHGFKSGRE